MRRPQITRKYKTHPVFTESKHPKYYNRRCWDMSVQRAVIFLNHNGFPEMEFGRVNDAKVARLFFRTLGLVEPKGEEWEQIHRLMELYLMDLWPFYAHDYGFSQSEEWQALREKVFKRHGRQCQCCGSTEKLHIDHVKPKSHYPGKRLAISNMQVLCAFCNLSKSNRHTTDYRRGGRMDLAKMALVADYRLYYMGPKGCAKRLPGQLGKLNKKAFPHIEKALKALQDRGFAPEELKPWFFGNTVEMSPMEMLGTKSYLSFDMAVERIPYKNTKKQASSVPLAV